MNNTPTVALAPFLFLEPRIPSLSCPRAFSPAVSSAWSTLSHPLSIHLHLINSPHPNTPPSGKLLWLSHLVNSAHPHTPITAPLPYFPYFHADLYGYDYLMHTHLRHQAVSAKRAGTMTILFMLVFLSPEATGVQKYLWDWMSKCTCLKCLLSLWVFPSLLPSLP